MIHNSRFSMKRWRKHNNIYHFRMNKVILCLTGTRRIEIFFLMQQKQIFKYNVTSRNFMFFCSKFKSLQKYQTKFLFFLWSNNHQSKPFQSTSPYLHFPNLINCNTSSNVCWLIFIHVTFATWLLCNAEVFRFAPTISFFAPIPYNSKKNKLP